jgi:hypothetical protein
MELIDGNIIAASLIAELKTSVAKLEGRPPCLALVRVGEDPASVSYVRKKEKTAAELKNDFNYIIRIFRKKKGVFTEFKPSVPYSGYFPRLKVDGKIGPIEGTIDYSIDFPQPFTPVKDSLKFQITIKDRAGNISNTTESSVIVLNEF